jgi:acyl-CoA hydrolase
MPAQWLPEAAGQASNSIFYQIEDLVTDRTNIKVVKSPQWAGEGLAVWNPANNLETLTLLVPVTQKGKYQFGLTIGKLKKEMPAAIEIELDGKVIRFNGSKEINITTNYQPVSRNAMSDVVELTEGIHVLTVGQAVQGSGKVGLDFLWVKRM